MTRANVIRLSLVLAAAVMGAVIEPPLLHADAYSDLRKVQAAFLSAKSWHADEHFSNGKTVTVDFVAPDRWRIQPTPQVTELLIGNDVYMVRNGKATKLPFGGGMIQNMIKNFSFQANDEIKQTAKDLGTQTLNGQAVHVYSYAVRGVPATLYVGPDMLPVQDVVQDKNTTTTIQYSKYNAPITIEP